MNHQGTKTERGLIPEDLDRSSWRVFTKCVLKKRGEILERQEALTIEHDGVRLEAGLRLDLLISRCLSCRAQSGRSIASRARGQLLTYLKLIGHRLGHVPLVRDGH